MGKAKASAEPDLSYIVEGLRPLAVPIESLAPDPRNARVHNERNLGAVTESLRRFGQRQPLVVQREGMIVRAGNGRMEAAKRLGWTHVAVVVVDDATPEALAYALTDNRTAELAEWDSDILTELLGELRADAEDLALLGWEAGDFPEIPNFDWAVTGTSPTTAAEVAEDAVPDLPAVAHTQPGDLWLLGGHRLLCGSSTSPEDVRRLMAGERAVLFATDPPYLVGYDPGGRPRGRNPGELPTEWDAPDTESDMWYTFCCVARADAIKEGAAWYCWHVDSLSAALTDAWTRAGAFVHQRIVWAKQYSNQTYAWYRWQHESCLMGWVRPHKPPRNPNKATLGTVWALDRVRGDDTGDHPTPKPVEAFAIPMEQHTLAGELCYEPFSGSGTQIIAAEQMGRRCYAMEIEPRYVDLAVTRWCRLTGQEATRESDGAVFPVPQA